eukprot:TRINITY_DN14032_c0_g1_i2.p1 TRINITY_DN14032_c0_g1~~TRINITY_DN14032_c0_g1_i2.p1  ORF type:complete len:189 (+),score=22.70 TRINITY_DN14032_c0_g1_i2:67-633(+)
MASAAPLLYHRVCALDDIEKVNDLINSCYRGEHSKLGWTTEADILGGVRSTPESLREQISQPHSVLLVFYESPESTDPLGTAFCEHDTVANKGYLGMLTVSPTLQSRGYGKFIMATAEKFMAETWGISAVKMTVIDCRAELIEFYNRRGYVDTGVRSPWDTSVHEGQLKVQNLSFVHLEKRLDVAQAQ